MKNDSVTQFEVCERTRTRTVNISLFKNYIIKNYIFKEQNTKANLLSVVEYLNLRVILLTELMLILFSFSTIICEYETFEVEQAIKTDEIDIFIVFCCFF